jgi:carboxymethylenebutenolidase
MEDSRRDLKDDHLNSLLPDVQVDRRGFVAACIAAGFAVTAEPLLAQAISTPMNGLDGGDVKIGDIPAYYAVPKGKGKRPVVLVVPEIWGLHEYIKDTVRRVAKAGYFAVSNDPYFRMGELWKLSEVKEVIGKATSLPDSQAFEDLDKVVAWAEKQPRADARKLGITGFCIGGRMVWMYTAHQKKVDAGVAWCHRSMFTKACRTRSTPTTARAIARKRPRTAGSGCWPGSRKTALPK